MIVLFLSTFLKGGNNIKNINKEKMIIFSGETQKVIINIINDGLIYLLERQDKIGNKDLLKNLTLFCFSLTGKSKKQIVTYEQLSLKEKRIFINIMLEGITDVILRNQYLNTIYLRKEDKKQITFRFSLKVICKST